MKKMEIYNRLKSPPKHALKKIGSGSRIAGFTNISPMWRIEAMTEEFGVCGIGWRFNDVVYTFEKGGGNEIVCFCDLSISVKIDNEWSDKIPGVGGSKFVADQKNGQFTSDECKKMAFTDAMGAAMKLRGVGADIYMGGKSGEEKQKYETDSDVNNDKENILKYKSWIDSIENIQDNKTLELFYKKNEEVILQDAFLHKLIANRKNVLEYGSTI